MFNLGETCTKGTLRASGRPLAAENFSGIVHLVFRGL